MADIRKETRDGRLRLTIGGDLTVLHANTIAAALRDAVQESAAVDIVIEGVTAADVTFPQAVCAAHRTAAAQSKEITVRGERQDPLGSLLLSAGFLRHIGCQDSTRKTCLWMAC